MAPSIYEYSSAAEWEQAMAEWCDENEPQHFLTHIDPQTHEESRVFVTRYDTRSRIQFHSEKTFRKYCPPGVRSGIGIYDHGRAGGAPSEYRALGLR